MTTDPRPLMSVVLTIYNEEKFLRSNLDSLLAQSLGERGILCVNDCSTDAIPEVFQEYAEKDSRIRIVAQENHGADMARNRRMQDASGHCFSFLDSDDFFETDRLEKRWWVTEQHRADITICHIDQYDSVCGVYQKNNWSIMSWMLPQNPFSPEDILEKLFTVGPGINSPGKILPLAVASPFRNSAYK